MPRKQAGRSMQNLQASHVIPGREPRGRDSIWLEHCRGRYRAEDSLFFKLAALIAGISMGASLLLTLAL